MPAWKDFTEQANQQFVPRIDGKFTGTTDAILSWGSCKWGLDEIQPPAFPLHSPDAVLG